MIVGRQNLLVGGRRSMEGKGREGDEGQVGECGGRGGEGSGGEGRGVEERGGEGGAVGWGSASFILFIASFFPPDLACTVRVLY